MSIVLQLPASLQTAGFSVCLALSAACIDTDSSSGRVCADCTAVEPGQGSSSTAGSMYGCSLAYLERSIDRAEAEALGFPVSGVVARIEEPIDTAMKWVSRESEGGGPATGYDPETRVRAAFKVESFEYRWLDPERCDGTLCTIDGEPPTEREPCIERYILTQASGTIETLDGAVTAEFPSQAVNLLHPEQIDDVVVSAAADLHEVRGTLRLDPSVPPPRVGRLYLSLQFADSQGRYYGVLDASVIPDWDNLTEDAASSIPGAFAEYRPIEGQWGDPPTGKPSVTPAE